MENTLQRLDEVKQKEKEQLFEEADTIINKLF